VKRVAVIGGGLAGLAAAAALAPRGFSVVVLESRQRLGGRAGSFTDPLTGQLIDACQHVSMGCCTNFTHFCQTIGIGQFLAPQPRLHFVTADGRRSVFKADPWPAPLHLGRALFGAHYLTATEKLRIAWGMLALLREPPDADPPLLDWLLAHKQTPRTIRRFWGVVLVSALNETVERLGLKYARKVFRDGFFQHRDGFVVHVPTVPLGQFYGSQMADWFTRHGVELRENAAVRRIATADRKVEALHLRDGSSCTADWYVLAVPFDRVADLLPETIMTGEPYFTRLTQLVPSPITSVHLWFDRPVMTLPHAVLVDCLGQWVFNRGQLTPGEFYVQVVVSAAGELKGLGRHEIQLRIVTELAKVFPAVRSSQLLRAKVVTEHAATFSAQPGVDQLRPSQASPLVNLALAGDWTATGWPATMEGAVRSGYLAAEVILERAGKPQRVLQPDLK
jgi:squalene-associated FAD-dependent desaturase